MVNTSLNIFYSNRSNTFAADYLTAEDNLPQANGQRKM